MVVDVPNRVVDVVVVVVAAAVATRVLVPPDDLLLFHAEEDKLLPRSQRKNFHQRDCWRPQETRRAEPLSAEGVVS